jgi:glutamate formiminotransferase / 5-formyltetrahydrofolate cyclo-ligase
VLECVVNVSEGQDRSVLDALAAAAAGDLLDVHTDPHHNRSVFTLVGTEAPRRLAAEAVARIDLRDHAGVHPRIGALDVVPFVPLGDATLEDAVVARDAFARWAGAELALPCFRYGPERSLPEVRRGAFGDLAPDEGPDDPHPTAGACAVGARPVLVAYNLWLDVGPDVARTVAGNVRGDGIRALGLEVGGRAQVSMNLVEPWRVGPDVAWDRVGAVARALGGRVVGAELVGLLPEAVLGAVDEARWASLDLGADRTIEARLAGRG